MGHQVYKYQSRFPELEGIEVFLAGSSPLSIFGSTKHCLPTCQTPNEDVLGKATEEEELKGLNLGLGDGQKTPSSKGRKRWACKTEQLILFLNKPPAVLPVVATGKKKPKRRENQFQNQSAASTHPSHPRGSVRTS